MRRAISTTLFLFLALSAFGQDAKTTLTKRYDELNSAVKKNDFKSIEKWINTNCTSDFTYTSKDKKTYKLKDFIAGMSDMTKKITKVNSSSYKFNSMKVGATRVTINVTSSLEAAVKFDTKTLRLTDKSDSTDVWIKVGSVWKVKSMVQSKADTQIFEK